MGTKVEGKRSVPYFTMGHFNLIAKGNNWSHNYYEEKPVNSQAFYNEFVANGYPCYDREMLKQTILQHEATFRKQVYELHRLYKIQKDLMESYQQQQSLQKFEGTIWNMQMQRPFSEFVTPMKDASAGLDLNEPGTDCSDMERSSVNYAGFQGIAEEGTSMSNYYNAPGEVRSGRKFTGGESNGHGKDMNGMNYIYPSTNLKQANGFISLRENNTATKTPPWIKQEQTNSHTSTPMVNKSNEQCNVRGLDLNLNDSLPDEEEPEIIVERKIQRNSIDLNDSLPWSDELDAPSEVRIGVAKRGFEIDLEAPAACEEEIITHDDDAYATAAAEAILAISVASVVAPLFDNSGNTKDTLAWFADVAIADRVRISGEMSGDESAAESFEALALRLEESKSEERFLAYTDLKKEHVAETLDETPGQVNRAVPRRGRRRQKKDFQKDILPTLVHLKKNEVTEDLQIFGRAGPSRRAGRRPKKIGPDSVVPVPVGGPSCQMVFSQAIGEGLASGLGWGRITRRCRKQRLPPGKISVNSN